MKKLFLLLLLIPLNLEANNFIEKTIDNHTIRAVEYETWSSKYNIKIVKSDTSTTLRDLLDKHNWITWINWVFFCPKDYRECNWESFTINERYIEWKKYWFRESTWDRVVFWWDKDENTFLFQTDNINITKEDDIFYWFANYPLLLRDWSPTTLEYWEKWLIVQNMRVRGTRNFICDNKENSKIFFWTISNATIDEAAIWLLKFWCNNALNLDAWASLSYIYNSRAQTRPSRDILDGVIIERVWLDNNRINTAAQSLSKQILSMINIWTTQEKIDNIWSFVDKLIKERNKIYSYFSTDIFDENDNKIWYRIEIDDLKTLMLVNTINLTQDYLQEIRNILVKYSNINFDNRLWVDFEINIK